MTSESRLPLQGVRVIDVATMLAAPFCAALLGDFGAEVIKVELPEGGDPFRRFGTMTESGASLNWLNDGRNKKNHKNKNEGFPCFRTTGYSCSGKIYKSKNIN